MSLQALQKQILETFLNRLRSNVWYQKYAALSPLTARLIWVIGVTAAISLALTLTYFYGNKIIALGSFASISAGLATGLGALPVLFFRRVIREHLNVMLGWAAGVMLAATAFSLVVPGIRYGNVVWPGNGVVVVAIGVLIGAMFLHFADRLLPFEHYLHGRDVAFTSLRKVWLFIIAITLHNFPEGMAVGVSFGSGDLRDGMILALAIGMQNIPEGLAVAVSLAGLGYSRRQAIGIATLTGLVEPIGGFLGVSAVAVFFPVLPIGMAFAAGAMLFVIADDIIPATQRNGPSRAATFAVMIGFVIMMVLDNIIST